jgi:hypothetical protein
MMPDAHRKSVRNDDLSSEGDRGLPGNRLLTVCVKLTYISHQLSRNGAEVPDVVMLPVAHGDRAGLAIGGGHEDIRS